MAHTGRVMYGLRQSRSIWLASKQHWRKLGLGRWAVPLPIAMAHYRKSPSLGSANSNKESRTIGRNDFSFLPGQIATGYIDSQVLGSFSCTSTDMERLPVPLTLLAGSCNAWTGGHCSAGSQDAPKLIPRSTSSKGSQLLP